MRQNGRCKETIQKMRVSDKYSCVSLVSRPIFVNVRRNTFVNRVRSISIGLIGLLLFSGCAIRPEGVSVKRSMTVERWQRIEAQFQENKEAATNNPETINLDQSPGVIAIGEVGPYRSFANPKTFRKTYDRYFKSMTDAGQTDQILSEQALLEIADGWTTVRVFNIPLVGGKTINALVKKGESENIRFSSSIGTILFSTRKDLVVAFTSVDQSYWMIGKVLCEDGKGFFACSKKYDRGVYDVYTGRELKSNYEIKPSGVLIDLTTYEKRSK